jgi:energy-converting hydrogenase Eha subunit E
VRIRIRTLLLDWPALAVMYWFLAYRMFLALLTIVVISTLAASILLDLVGIRWGW